MSDAQRSSESAPVLEIRNATKLFGPVRALNGVNLELGHRQVLGLLGDNGAGKSTLIKAITGVHQLTSGEMLIDGKPVHFKSPTDAREYGIEAVYQDLALFDNLGIVNNLYLGNELTRPRRFRALGWLDRKAMEKDARRRLETLQVHLPSFSASVGLMSGGQRQAVAVARAVAFASKVLILDEPTAALGLRETRNVLNTIKELPEKYDISVILISHNMDHVVEVCDRAVIMRQGGVVGQLEPTEETMAEMVSLIVGATKQEV
ncbi:ATP-binding cassette domain-containing protein [Gulosibacter sp. 10]|uniref:ATP-binding cassette domain-containing protein n=1 Tax=Gulosibacter sp. 10 TaxID=1255570 RepID=UPI00097F39EE|nr:ATP-binding cassette domain-containing protein [Gulosibacter sp. 10]SJM67422.1 Sugar ABC transporter, ATP binding protein [Gulosibacter sp. 10]